MQDVILRLLEGYQRQRQRSQEIDEGISGTTTRRREDFNRITRETALAYADNREQLRRRMDG